VAAAASVAETRLIARPPEGTGEGDADAEGVSAVGELPAATGPFGYFCREVKTESCG
jgi:hypothetical protein